ncbi:hypothetical protein BS78_05G149200 [Paspalum vaginatum]|nr:hypothetical protein BS78_05G149200 [Paspalum vaginatum]KAJ1275620.1 hypothetical protein BS78_05G149200 [Paspalum vaginatum]
MEISSSSIKTTQLLDLGFGMYDEPVLAVPLLEMLAMFLVLTFEQIWFLGGRLTHGQDAEKMGDWTDI